MALNESNPGDLLRLEALRRSHVAQLATRLAVVATKAAMAAEPGKNYRTLPWVLANLLRAEWIIATQEMVTACLRIPGRGNLTVLSDQEGWIPFEDAYADLEVIYGQSAQRALVDDKPEWDVLFEASEACGQAIDKLIDAVDMSSMCESEGKISVPGK